MYFRLPVAIDKKKKHQFDFALSIKKDGQTDVYLVGGCSGCLLFFSFLLSAVSTKGMEPRETLFFLIAAVPDVFRWQLAQAPELGWSSDLLAKVPIG